MRKQLGVGIVALCLGAAPPAFAELDPYDAHLEAMRDRGERALASETPTSSAPRVSLFGTRASPRAGASPAEAARRHLVSGAEQRGATAAAHGAELREVHDTGRGGIIVRFRQRVGGYDIVGGQLSVLMTRDLELVAVSGDLFPQAAADAVRPEAFEIAPDEAIAGAIEDRYGAEVQLAPAASEIRSGGLGAEAAFHIAPSSRTGVYLHEPARARPVLYPLGGELIPAYALHFVSSLGPSTEVTGQAYVIGARDGELLRRHSLSAGAGFDYRVWARDDELGTPHDGPQGSENPHPSGEPEDRTLEFIEPRDVSMLGFNANPDGEPDPWLPEGATETRGNNVDAYADHTLPDGFNEGEDVRAEISADGEFLHSYDPEAEPLDDDEQIMASVTQLFYVTNSLHNWYYDSGFDEAAGNAQEDNFDRGGVPGDRLLAEAQDAARTDDPPRNNANMLVPPEGTSPRMQMYLWDGPTEARVDALGRELSPVGVAQFGPADFDLEAEVVLVDDGETDTETGDEGSVTDACHPIQNDVSDALALVDRGGCTFETKAVHAEAAGAAGLIVANDEEDGVVQMAQGEEPAGVDIPALMITLGDGDDLKAALPETARMFRDSSAPERDGTLDNTIVAHEWGHYIHFRLVEDCQTTLQCRAMSEGFADFIALHMSIDEGDDLGGAYAVGQYAAAALPDSVYYGVRRVPYSTNPDINDFTFEHIQRGVELPDSHPISGGSPDNAQVHNAGEVWATALLDAYAALLLERDHEFEDARRRMSDYLVAGMKLAPPAPTYTEQARALLSAVWAADEEDFAVMAEAFAGRGFGSGAASPPRYSTDLVGVTASFDTAPELRLADAELRDDIDSCDDDGVLDLTETGTLTLTLENAGFGELRGTTVTVTADEPAISFPEGDSATIADVAPISSQQVEIPVAADDTLPDLAVVEFEVAAQDGDGQLGGQPFTVRELVNYDVVRNASTSDDMESPETPWSTEDLGPAPVWSLAGERGEAVWRGEQVPVVTDSRLVSPELEVGATDRLTISYRHRHSFAALSLDDEDGDINFAGGVVEIREPDGEWQDVSELAAPRYIGVIGIEGIGNPLQGRAGYVAENADYPGFEDVTLDFGREFSGSTVQIRFRIGAGEGLSAAGWEIDAVSVSGITNTPFYELQGEGGDCETLGSPSGCGGCASGGGGRAGTTLVAAALLWLMVRRRKPGRPTSRAGGGAAAAAGLVLALFLVTGGDAHAQRGGDYVVQSESIDTPKQGFPGAFNTRMAKRGGVVANLPLFQLDYGVTENFTAGINLLPAVSVFGGNHPGAAPRLRYRLYAGERFQSVATLQGGYMRTDDASWTGGYASTAFGLSLTDRQNVTFTALGLTVRGADEFERTHVSTFGFALDYDAFMTDRLGVNATLVSLPGLFVRESSPSENISARPPALGSLADQTFVRLLLAFRAGETWLLEAGGFAPLSLEVGTPWLSATKRW